MSMYHSTVEGEVPALCVTESPEKVLGRRLISLVLDHDPGKTILFLRPLIYPVPSFHDPIPFHSGVLCVSLIRLSA